MTNDDVARITEVGMIIGRFAGEDAKKAFLEGSENLARDSKEEVAVWLKRAMARLDALVNEETRTEIMENCGFNCAKMHRGNIWRARKKRSMYESLGKFLEAEQKKPSKGTRIERRGDVVYQYYTPNAFRVRCYCSLWRGLPANEVASNTWCQCAKGFIMKVWEAYLGKTPKVELLGSCISGAKECKFAIHLSAEPHAT